MPKFVFFTDLDGTLLDFRDYSFEEALPAVKRIKESGSALVFCTSKTRAETGEYGRILGLREPMVVENGGAIYIPKGYFSHGVKGAFEEKDWLVIKLGANARELEAVIDEIGRKHGIKSFHGMGIEEIMEDTGLNREQAMNAKKKEFIASFRNPGPEALEEIRRDVEAKGYALSVGARYSAVMGDNTKGKAVRVLERHYRQEFGEIFSVGLGDAPNDAEMLQACDRAFVMPNRKGKYFSQDFEKVLEPGPAGWNRTVLSILKKG